MQWFGLNGWFIHISVHKIWGGFVSYVYDSYDEDDAYVYDSYYVEISDFRFVEKYLVQGRRWYFVRLRVAALSRPVNTLHECVRFVSRCPTMTMTRCLTSVAVHRQV